MPHEVSTVCMMGPSKSGKSWLLNHWMAQPFFRVSSLADPATTEINASPPVRLAGASVPVVFIDTPGLWGEQVTDVVAGDKTRERRVAFDRATISGLSILCDTIVFNTRELFNTAHHRQLLYPL